MSFCDLAGAASAAWIPASRTPENTACSRGSFARRAAGQILQLALEQIEIDRFGHKLEGPVLGRASAALVVAICGYHHNRELRALLLDHAQQFKPIHPRHVDIREDDNQLG